MEEAPTAVPGYSGGRFCDSQTFNDLFAVDGGAGKVHAAGRAAGAGRDDVLPQRARLPQSARSSATPVLPQRARLAAVSEDDPTGRGCHRWSPGSVSVPHPQTARLPQRARDPHSARSISTAKLPLLSRYSVGLRAPAAGDDGAGEGGGDVQIARAVGERIRVAARVRPLVRRHHQPRLHRVRRQRRVLLQQQRRRPRHHRRRHGRTGEVKYIFQGTLGFVEYT